MPKLHFIKAGLLTALLAGAAMPVLAQPGGDRQGWQSQRGGDTRPQRAETRPGAQGSRMSDRGPAAARPSAAPRMTDRAAPSPRIQREATPRPGTPAARPQVPHASPPTSVAPPRTDTRPGQQSPRWQNDGHRARPDGDRNRPDTPNWRDRNSEQDRARDRPDASRDRPGGSDWRDRDRDRPNQNWRDRDRDRPNQNWGDRDRPGQNWRPPNNRPPTTTRPPNRPPVVNRWQGYRPWANSWRNDRRYDWQYWRRTNRDIFRMPHYYAPYGWSGGYFRFSIGAYLDDLLFGSSYWIDDPYRYRLPPAYGYLRWVRYYDDALLVDIRDGYVVDIVYDVFW